MNQLAPSPAQASTDPAAREPAEQFPRMGRGPERPYLMPLPGGWRDSPLAVDCPLDHGPRSARAARRLTRRTLCAWGMNPLIEDAEIIVGELVANAVTHAVPAAANRELVREDLGLRLLNRTSEVICAVLDPSDAAPVLKFPESPEETGRGLQMVEALSDVWGWSPMAGRGKAVWAILFCARPRGAA